MEDVMKKSICVIILSIVLCSLTFGQKIVEGGKFEPEIIKSELAKKYKTYNGLFKDQSVELWDAYFLKSPNIGNMHEGRPEIGWKKFHDGNIKFVEAKMNGEMLMDSLKIYPISSNNAWVKGIMVVKMGGQTYRDIFHDSLVRTVEGWRVTLSVVNPEKK